MLGGQPRTKRVLHMGCVPKRSHLRGQIRFPQPDYVGVARIQSGRALPRYMPAYPFPALYMRSVCLPAFYQSRAARPYLLSALDRRLFRAMDY